MRHSFIRLLYLLLRHSRLVGGIAANPSCQPGPVASHCSGHTDRQTAIHTSICGQFRVPHSPPICICRHRDDMQASHRKGPQAQALNLQPPCCEVESADHCTTWWWQTCSVENVAMGKHDALSFVVQTLVTSLLYLDYFTLGFFFYRKQ